MKIGKVSIPLVLVFLLSVTLFPVITSVKGETEVRDLVVSLKGPIFRNEWNHLTSGKSTVLNTTVLNKGTITETDVNLQILVNDTEVLSTTATLPPGEMHYSLCSWTPEDGKYYVTAYSPPKINETSTVNNNDTKWVWVCPDQAPVANFTFEPKVPPNVVVVNETITFDASASYDPDWGTIVNYTWNFDDDSPIETYIGAKNYTAIHTYENLGDFNVTLTIFDTENLNDTTWYKPYMVKVDDLPIADFTVSNPPYCDEGPPYYVNHTLTFNASDSTPDGGDIVSYRWDFGDDNVTTVTKETITHVYVKEKEYKVTLTVTDNRSLSDSYWESIEVVLGRPIAEFAVSPELPVVNEPVTFNASDSHDPDGGSITSYEWNFGDGSLIKTYIGAKNYTAIHIYNSTGTYNVNLTVTDNDNLTGSDTRSIRIWVGVKVEPTPVWSNPGETFKVNITVTNVVDLYSYEFNLTYLCDLLTCKNVEPGDFLGGPADINWDREFPPCRGYAWAKCIRVIPGGVSGNGTLAIITFSVTTSGNCTLHFTKTKLLNSTGSEINHVPVDGYFCTGTPVASFTYRPSDPKPGDIVTFNASDSYDPDNPYDETPGPIASYEWDFGDGNIARGLTAPIVTHTYNESGVYTVKLIVTDDDNETSPPKTKDVPVGIIHDVAIISVTATAADSYNGSVSLFNITIVVKNEGNIEENFTVTAYYNFTVINYTTVINLAPNDQTTITFHWDVTNRSIVQKGKYIISANASVVLGEKDTADNTCIAHTLSDDGTVGVGVEADVNGDGKVNILDAIRLARAFGSKPGDEKWDPCCDLNDDDTINILDAIKLARHFGEKDC